MNEVLKNMEARHSVRAYTDRQVSAEDLNLILRAATCAPNGMHLETWHFTAIQNATILNELNEAIRTMYNKGTLQQIAEKYGLLDALMEIK